MNYIKKIALSGVVMATFMAPAVHAEEMMKKDDAMMMKPSDDKMMKSSEDKMMTKDHGMMMESAQVKFTQDAFAEAEKSGKPFLVAFHKKGCPLCAEQQKALDSVYKEPAAKGLKVLVVDYDNDTQNLKKFSVGEQGTLILYKGTKEISRTTALTDKAQILKQIKG